MSFPDEHPGGGNSLTDLEVPDLLSAQLAKINPNSAHVMEQGQFDPSLTLARLEDMDGREVMGVDFGGNNLQIIVYKVCEGALVPDELRTITKTKEDAADYLTHLSYAAKHAQLEGMPVGISFAGPIEGTVPAAGINLPGEFMASFKVAWGGDFAHLFPTLRVVKNDAEAGLLAGALQAKRTWHEPQGPDNVIYVVNGSGLGTAMLRRGVKFSAEPGHVEVLPELNPFKQDRPCGMFGQEFVCIERVAASGAGVEDIWGKAYQRQLSVSGRNISARYQKGGVFEQQLYADSALLTAHVIDGLGCAMGVLGPDHDNTALVLHGGIFEVPEYGERVLQILTKRLSGYRPPALYTKDFSSNACAEGAAVAALTAKV